MGATSSAPPEALDAERQELLDRLAPRYLWWDFSGSIDERNVRVLTQIMDLGTYDDIRAIERLWQPEELGMLLDHAEPGWFSPRSWSFWKGRLGYQSGQTRPPQRTFRAGDL
jgi:hypothetical protein